MQTHKTAVDKLRKAALDQTGRASGQHLPVANATSSLACQTCDTATSLHEAKLDRMVDAVGSWHCWDGRI